MISYLLIADPLNLIDTYDATADWFAPHDSYHVIRLDNYPPYLASSIRSARAKPSKPSTIRWAWLSGSWCRGWFARC